VTASHTAARWRTGWAPLLAMGLLAVVQMGCLRGAPPILGCEPAHRIVPDCRFQNPEDLAVSPSGRFLLVSQFGSVDGTRAGSLAAYDPAAGSIEILFPGQGASSERPEPAWGEPSCTPPPTDAFAPHGIDVEQLEDGTQALYVVNHGGRESVEMFEVEDDGRRVGLVWRGCVTAPRHGYFNDLVVLRDGGFWVSQMFPREAHPVWMMLRMRVGRHAPGYAYHWSADSGFRRIAGTETRFANGIEKSMDERHLFLSSYLGDEVLKVDTVTGSVVGRAPVPSPDNLTWAPNGELLAAGHLASLPDFLSCTRLEEGSCGFRFQIVAIEAETMSARTVLDHEGPPMGAATVALVLGDGLYLGTFAGDRIARVSADVLEPSSP
jgi:hypothetical protein